MANDEHFPAPEVNGLAPEADPQLLLYVRERIEELGGEAVCRDRWGLGEAELVQSVEYGEFKGPLIDAVAHRPSEGGRPCPVGADLEQAKKEDGMVGVENKLRLLGELAGTKAGANGQKVKKFDVIMSDDTRRRELLKKKK